MVPVALIWMWLHLKPIFVFFVLLSCFRIYWSMRDEVCSSEIRHQETFSIPVCLYVVEIELKPFRDQPYV